MTSIAIIDDDALSSCFLENLLGNEGLITIKARNGPEGRERVRLERPDLVLLDIQMPRENGLETCRLLKADPATADIPVIFLTGTEDFQTKMSAFQAGAADYITKPYQALEVLARISVHIRARRMARLLVQAQLEGIGQAQKDILVDSAVLPEARFSTFYQPMHSVGGDFYEVLQAGDQIFDYVVADVSGHDARASLLTSALKVLLHQGCSTLSSPLETLRMVNRAVCSAFPSDIYLTLGWARLNRRRKTLTTILAGHPPMLHLSRERRSEFIQGPGDILGAFDPIELQEITRPVCPGDRLLLFTDGLIEVEGEYEHPDRARGMNWLLEAAEARMDLPLALMVQGVAVELLRRAPEVSDDLLLLGVEV